MDHGGLGSGGGQELGDGGGRGVAGADAGDTAGAGASPDDRDVAAVSEVFAALSSPVRVAIIDHLDHEQACVHDLVSRFGLPQPQVSQHLRVLRAADLVVGTRRGREVVYALADEHVAHIVRDALVHAREGARP